MDDSDCNGGPDSLVDLFKKVLPHHPAQLAAELGAVDGVAPVVAGAVAHPVEVILEE